MQGKNYRKKLPIDKCFLSDYQCSDACSKRFREDFQQKVFELTTQLNSFVDQINFNFGYRMKKQQNEFKAAFQFYIQQMLDEITKLRKQVAQKQQNNYYQYEQSDKVNDDQNTIQMINDINEEIYKNKKLIQKIKILSQNNTIYKEKISSQQQHINYLLQQLQFQQRIIKSMKNKQKPEKNYKVLDLKKEENCDESFDNHLEIPIENEQQKIYKPVQQKMFLKGLFEILKIDKSVQEELINKILSEFSEIIHSFKQITERVRLQFRKTLKENLNVKRRLKNVKSKLRTQNKLEKIFESSAKQIQYMIYQRQQSKVNLNVKCSKKEQDLLQGGCQFLPRDQLQLFKLFFFNKQSIHIIYEQIFQKQLSHRKKLLTNRNLKKFKLLKELKPLHKPNHQSYKRRRYRTPQPAKKSKNVQKQLQFQRKKLKNTLLGGQMYNQEPFIIKHNIIDLNRINLIYEPGLNASQKYRKRTQNASDLSKKINLTNML